MQIHVRLLTFFAWIRIRYLVFSGCWKMLQSIYRNCGPTVVAFILPLLHGTSSTRTIKHALELPFKRLISPLDGNDKRLNNCLKSWKASTCKTISGANVLQNNSAVLRRCRFFQAPNYRSVLAQWELSYWRSRWG